VISTYVRDEAYFLQIDAHTRFDDGWDDVLIGWMSRLPGSGWRNIISSYPCAFEFDGSAEVRRPMPGHALVLRPRPEARLEHSHPITSFHAVPTRSAKPIAGCHIGAGCLFAPVRLLSEVPIDPWLYFHGEEQNLAVRAWTRGWNIWHVPDVPLYHWYHTGQGRPVHWDSADDESRRTRWWEFQQQAERRMSELLYTRADLGVYGLGQSRSLDEFAHFSGLDYARRMLAEPAAPTVIP
jgi:hypothetical protein